MITDADVLAAVAAHEPDARAAIEFVHGHPELGHSEFQCSKFLADQLAAKGLDIQRGVGGMDTAFTATVQGAKPGRSVGLVCLCDAVSTIRPNGTIEPVHSCGHGVIAGSVVAAALALADHRTELAGKVVVFGLPADEIHAAGTVRRGGGKAISAETGLWNEMDVALYSHPEFIDTVSLASRWMRREHVHLFGARSLTGELEPPLRAAQAILAANALDVMVENVTLDGDVEDGTSLALQADLLVFADTEASSSLAARQRARPSPTAPGRPVSPIAASGTTRKSPMRSKRPSRPPAAASSPTHRPSRSRPTSATSPSASRPP